MEGKHAGSLVKLKEIIERKGGKPNEALVQGKSDEFITVAKYLFVVDEGFKSG
jgi:ribosomal protein S4E